jgi:hypothetical protein
LRDDHVDAAFRCLTRLRDRRHLQHDAGSDIVGLAHQIARIAERKRNDGGLGLQGVAKRFGIQHLRNVIDREVTVGQGSDHVDVALDRYGGTEQRADATKPALVRDRRGQFCRCARSHRGKNNGHIDTQHSA